MEPNSPKLSPEMLVPRLGEYLLQKGLISEADLQRALTHQQNMAAIGGQSLLGQALVELKLLEKDTLDQVITELIIQLRSALQSSNRTLEQRVRERTAELNEALNRLSELNQMKANFVANISHELLISESLGPIGEEQRHALSVSQRASGKLEDMIEDLIMFSLASRGEMSMKLASVDIRRLISLVGKSAARKAEERGVNLIVNPPENLPLVQADAEKISWVVTQLLDNGIKFTPSGGTVTVTVEEEGHNLVQVMVVDTGIGIPQSRMQEIFEPFHQLDGSSTRRFGGTGLGLSLVRQIVEAHGSLLDVKSDEGKGTTFKFPLLAMRE